MALGNTNDVNHLILSKNSSDGDLLLKVFPGKVNLVSNRTTIKLDLHDVSLLLPSAENLHLCVDNHTDGGAVLLHLIQILLDLFLAKIISPLSAGLSEGLLLGLRPVLVEPSLALFSDVFGPDSLEGS